MDPPALNGFPELPGLLRIRQSPPWLQSGPLMAGPELRTRRERLLLRPCHRDSDPSLDPVRGAASGCAAGRSPRDDPGVGLHERQRVPAGRSSRD